MPNRREIIRVGVAAGAWPLTSSSVGAVWSSHPLVPLYKVVFDRRHRQSVEFAERARVRGIATVAIDGDMTRVWYDDIHWAWRRGGTAIAGLTEHGALFCFDQLARDYGMRVVFRGEHTVTADGSGLAHEVSGPASMLDACRPLEVAGERWPSVMAEAVSRCPLGRAAATTRHGANRGEPPQREAGDRLYTWVIAPSVRSARHRAFGA